MRIAVIGGGISGLCAASQLHPQHDIVVFEAGPYLGGHSNTVQIVHEGRNLAVDTGFIVFNQRTYPNFCRMLTTLGVASQDAPMSFSVRCDQSGLEYGGESLRGIFAQPSNLLRPSFLAMLRDIRRLGRRGKALLADVDDTTTLGQLCTSARFSRSMVEHYLIPMGSAIWSAPRDAMDRFPARFFLRFFDNHGMLDLRERPQWRTITGGSQSYVARLIEGFADRCRVGCAVHSVRREPAGVQVHSSAGCERFDQVILALHADQALAILADASGAECEILSAMPYQANHAVLHTDAAVLPRRRAAWAGWNYRLGDQDDAPVSVTYNLTLLQSLGTRDPVCVTLNDPGRIDPRRVLGRYLYHHPLYTVPGIAARARWAEISGVNRTHFCGAYWMNGFHEDGLVSALRVCRSLGVTP